MSGAQVKAVMELSAIPELGGLHPDDLAGLARHVAWPREEAEEPADPDADGHADADEESEAVHLLLAGRASVAGKGSALEAPALIGALEAMAGLPLPNAVGGEEARIARLRRSEFRSLLADVFELWLAMLHDCMARLLAAEPEPVRRPAPDHAGEGEAELVQRIRLLAGCELLDELRVHTLGLLARGMQERRLEAGEALWEQGDAASHCFLVLDGAFAQHTASGSERPIDAPPGSMLGLRQALADTRHTSRMVATEPGCVLDLARERLIDELEDDPDAAEALLAAVARRTLQAEAGAR